MHNDTFKGQISILSSNNRLQLRFTYQGKRQYLSLGLPDTPTNRALAEVKAQALSQDLRQGCADTTWQKYKLGRHLNLVISPKTVESDLNKCENFSTVLEVVSPIQVNQKIGLRELWNRFLADKLPSLKAKTQDEYCNFTNLLDKIEKNLSFDALQTKQALLSVTTTDQVRRMLQYLSACCDWGIKHRLIIDNPYKGLSSEIPKRKSVTHPEPNAFTEDERDAVINAFRNDKRSGMNYSRYAPIVEFWFLTGCRPSEAIGLTWGKVAENCSSISFSGSIQTIKGIQVWSEGSKNNNSRTIAISHRVQQLLVSIKPKCVNSKDLVFPSPKGKAINYPNFISKIWGKVVDPIKPDTTPYNCRDTFITLQLLKGVPSAVIAKWCDTSTGMIDKNYADKLKLSQLRPID
jgi:integrase